MKILKPPKRGIGSRFCFLSSEKSSNFFLKANLLTTGKKKKVEIKDMQNVLISVNKLRQSSLTRSNYTTLSSDIIS